MPALPPTLYPLNPSLFIIFTQTTKHEEKFTIPVYAGIGRIQCGSTGL
jgi:hypothetical protein